MTILVTGGAGFIGSNFVIDWLTKEKEPVVTIDKLTYAGNLSNLKDFASDPRHTFVQGDIADGGLLRRLFSDHQPRAIIHFAAESHVDRSILGPTAFIQTNVMGTFNLLEATRAWWNGLGKDDRDAFRFVHISTDEVYGSLSPADDPFTEQTPYAPNSPYSASKASSDHLVRAYHHTYGLPTLTTNCSNNYGPYQFPEKLIPLMILNALREKPLPVYGDGLNVRDWLYVGDHCSAIRTVLSRGQIGEVYNIGGGSECTNIEVVQTICAALDTLRPRAGGAYAELIHYVKDRPGHDRRYAIDSHKLMNATGWAPSESFATGLRRTIQWYLDHPEWIANVESGAYLQWMKTNYGKRPQ